MPGDDPAMTTSIRPLVAVVGMSIGLVALVIDNVTQGWGVLGAIGIAGFALGITAELFVIRGARGH